MSEKIAKIQKIVFEILIDIDEYCRANNIQYFLSGGSCLGAVRHSDFIPWDDDADIMMPRIEYLRFFKGFSKTYGDKYGMSTLELDEEWKIPSGRIWNLKSVSRNINLDMKSIGIFVDVFPIDGLPKEKKRQIKFFKKIKRMNIMRHAALRVQFKKNEHWKIPKRFMAIYCKAKGARYFAEKIQNEALKYNYEDADEVAVSMACHYWEKEIIEKRHMESATLLEFNGKEFPVPVGYDTYLRNLYGDYMRIPRDVSEQGYTHLGHWEVSIEE
ncbi:lipopolysaccharide cholinephosphotransferase [Lachnospiraceae bacterium PM6-15]|uniref:LicD family protein n=1 Tax=Ohessyouella blattaphilus TaxID=2949333 RepID=A0ABT1EIH7_9FIRM|nr:LicD family protein [Ohessyouella blattaphilus]MCP1109486.1 LicD family protein [Ohessyouella blattaphilus]MCR8562880.1 LicD family protein [Ohessyouella blattaphilus]